MKTNNKACESCGRNFTDKQIESERYVTGFILEHGKPPTYRDVAKHHGIVLSAAYARLKHCRGLMNNKL